MDCKCMTIFVHFVEESLFCSTFGRHGMLNGYVSPEIKARFILCDQSGEMVQTLEQPVIFAESKKMEVENGC